MRVILVRAVTVLALFASAAQAVVIPANGNDADFVTAGQAASGAGLFGAIEGVHQSGSTFFASVTMLTDFTGNRFEIQPVPDHFGATIDLAGFGKFKHDGEALQLQDGKPRTGSAHFNRNNNPLMDPTVYGTNLFDPASYGPTNVGATPGDSGGRMGIPAGPIGVLDAVDGTDSGSTDYFTMLAPLEGWIDGYIDSSGPGSIWGVTAAHVSVDHGDPVTLTHVNFTDYYNPSAQYTVIQTINYPTWAGDFGTVDGFHPDIALVQLSPTPEPASALILSVACVAMAMRRRRAA